MMIQLKKACETDLQIAFFATEMSNINPCLWDIDFALDHVD